MNRHRFDPIAAVFGLLVAAAALVVITRSEISTGWWLGVGAVLIGLAIVPWHALGSRSTAPDPELPEHVDEPGDELLGDEATTSTDHREPSWPGPSH